MDNDTNLLTPPPPPPPGSAPGPAPRPRLTRRPDQGMVAGVAAGLGEYFDVDPVLFRVGFVVLAFVWGLAIPVYLAAWLLIPPAAGTASHGRVRGRVGRTIGQWPRWFSIAVV